MSGHLKKMKQCLDIYSWIILTEFHHFKVYSSMQLINQARAAIHDV